MTVRGRCLETGEPMEVIVAQGRIAALRYGREVGEPPADVWVLPGLFDIQVNGYDGYNFNGREACPEAAAAIVRRLWREGVTYLCPTVTTNAFEAMEASLRAIMRACEDSLVAACIPCIHVEGPYLSPEDGPRGAHPKEHLRPPNWDEFRRWQEAAEGRIGIVTLAPELPGALEFIERLVEEGVVAAIGHTAAGPEVLREAIAAGARLSTHLGNGAHAMLPRHPNYLWEQAAADELWASLILDGHHLPPSVAKCLIRCKGVERTILISDAVFLAGKPPGRYYTHHGRHVEISPDGRCSMLGTPLLAGAVLPLKVGVANAVRFAGVSPAEAVRMATLNPARLLGREGLQGRLAVGQEASLTLVRWQPWVGRIEVLETWVAGRKVYPD